MTDKIKHLKDPHAGQFQYCGRWVDKKTFRAFVYDKEGNECLANSYNEFEQLTTNGIWFASKPQRKKKDVVL
jgi:hypothetical protein